MSAFNFASRLFNTPALLREQSRDAAIGLLADWAASMREGSARAVDTRASVTVSRPYDVVAGVAIVPVRGVLIQRVGAWGWLADLLGIGGYDVIRLMFMTALADEGVEAICLAVDSPGGDVAGCFDLVDTIYSARGVKPIWAILDESAYSAAYALASAADRIVVPRTGGVGSVGVIYMHVSIEEALAKAGFEVTLITKGALKGSASEFTALSKDAIARIQADVNEVGALFDATVARNRGMPAEAVAATEAGTFLGQAGVDIGFADRVASPDAAFRALLAELG